ncbi:MAG: carbonic anhydrase [Desulfobulbaceae bacterium]|nr:carbonic anhydrase [Desulfobulbaceae bacterium]
MKKLIASAMLATSLLVAPAAFAEMGTGTDPNVALAHLMEGNKGFAKYGDVSNLEKMSSVKTRVALAAGQNPEAIIVTCSDSRLSPEILFDKGLGQVFVIRVAGNIVAPHELGSIEYAVEHLGTRLIMVLGHSACGAVKATYGAADPATGIVPEAAMEGNIGSLLKDIAPAVEESYFEGTEACIVTNIKNVVESMENSSEIVREGLELGLVKVVGAKYDLTTGKVSLLEEETHH